MQDLILCRVPTCSYKYGQGILCWNQLDQNAVRILDDLVWYNIASNEDHMVCRAREWDGVPTFYLERSDVTYLGTFLRKPNHFNVNLYYGSCHQCR